LSKLPSVVIGYHGGDRADGLAAAVDGNSLRMSNSNHDWLGVGTYFWDSDPQRALEWAQEKKENGKCADPFVVGAIIDLGNCFDLSLRPNLDFLAEVYRTFEKERLSLGLKMPINRDSPNGSSRNKVIRSLDCAIINYVHTLTERAKLPAFDTVRGIFVEGDPAYPGSEIYHKTHIQIAVKNPDCIKAVFIHR
jgi:hypothetical protein